MTHTQMLEEKIKQSGKKKKFLAEKVGLSAAGFRNCCNNRSEFTSSQVKILCRELDINSLKEMQAIFFAEVVA